MRFRPIGSFSLDRKDLRYFASSGLWMNLGSVSVSLFSLGLYMLFARVLSPETYGMYQYLLSAGALLGALTLTGMNNAVIRSVALGKEGVVKASLIVQLKWGLLPLVVSFAIGAYYLAQGNTVLGIGFLLLGVCTPVNNALNTYAAFLAGRKDFRRAFYYNFLINVCFYGALGIAALLVPSALLLIAVNLFVQAIALFCAYLAMLKTCRPNAEHDPESITYGKHLSAMGVLGAVAIQVDVLFVFHYLGPVAVAVYAFATAVPDRLGGLFKFIPSSLLPHIASEDDVGMRRVFSYGPLGLVVLGIAALALAYAVIAPYLFAILFPAYAASVPYSQLYALSMISVIGAAFSTGLIAQKRIKSLYVFNTVLPIMTIAALWIGISLFGLWGIIVAKIVIAWVLVLFSALLLFRPVRRR